MLKHNMPFQMSSTSKQTKSHFPRSINHTLSGTTSLLLNAMGRHLDTNTCCAFGIVFEAK